MPDSKINGYGEYFRFITPILVTIACILLGFLLSDMKELKLCFSNHLEHHRVMEVSWEGRLSGIETKLSIREQAKNENSLGEVAGHYSAK